MAGPRSPISLSRPRSFRGVEESIRFDVVQSFNNVQMNGWSCSPKRGPFLFTVLKNLLVWMFCSHVKHSSLWLGRAPQHPCHGPAHFAALKIHFVLMLCKHSITFKWTDVRASPNTVQGILRFWRTFSFGWYEAFQKHSNLWLGRAPPNTAQFFSRCWRTISSGCYAAT